MGDGAISKAWEKLKSLLGITKKPPPSPQPCKPPPKHWVVVRLRYKDDKTDVPAADGMILLGEEVLDRGPLAAGKMEDRDIDAGSYEVSFDIDASEWQAE